MPNLRKILFDKPGAGTFVSIDEFGYFCIRMSTKHDMYMVFIMLPFFQRDVVRRTNADKNILSILTYLVRKYIAAILHN